MKMLDSRILSCLLHAKHFDVPLANKSELVSKELYAFSRTYKRGLKALDLGVLCNNCAFERNVLRAVCEPGISGQHWDYRRWNWLRGFAVGNDHPHITPFFELATERPNLRLPAQVAQPQRLVDRQIVPGQSQREWLSHGEVIIRSATAQFEAFGDRPLWRIQPTVQLGAVDVAQPHILLHAKLRCGYQGLF